MPAFWAAAVAAGADFLLILTGPLDDLSVHEGLLTPFGTAVQLVDYLRFGACRRDPRVRCAGGRGRGIRRHPNEVDLGASRRRGRDDAGISRTCSVTRARRIALVDNDGTWRMPDGAARAAPGPERAVTMLMQDDVAVAALEYDDVVRTASGARRGRRRRARAAARGGTPDDARPGPRGPAPSSGAATCSRPKTPRRSRLERDLHDGAQQALVGLSLHAALAARGAATADDTARVARELADAIDETRVGLVAIASGRPPALLAERGLDGALGALVLTAGLPVAVEADTCADLPERLQRAIWFTASEAVTNAAEARRRVVIAAHLAEVGERHPADGRGRRARRRGGDAAGTRRPRRRGRRNDRGVEQRVRHASHGRVRGGGPMTRGRAAALVVTGRAASRTVAVALRRPPRARRLRPRRRERAATSRSRSRACSSRSQSAPRPRSGDPRRPPDGCSPAPPRAPRAACGGSATRRSVRRSRSRPSTRRHCFRCTRSSCRATASASGTRRFLTTADVVLAALGIAIVGTAESGVIEHWFQRDARTSATSTTRWSSFDAPECRAGGPGDLVDHARDGCGHRDRRAAVGLAACAPQRAPARHRGRVRRRRLGRDAVGLRAHAAHPPAARRARGARGLRRRVAPAVRSRGRGGRDRLDGARGTPPVAPCERAGRAPGDRARPFRRARAARRRARHAERRHPLHA